MDYNRIIGLIDKYWEGDTSLNEEQEIQSFFVENESLPAFLEQYRKWFVGVKEVSDMVLGEDFDNRILSEIDRQLTESICKIRFRRWRIASIAVAASLLLFLGWMKFVNPKQKMTYAEAQEAVLLVKDVLCFTSANLNKAENIAQESLKRIDIMNEYIKIKEE